MRDKYDFLHEHKHQTFSQAGSSVFAVKVRHTQSTQNSTFVISLQHVKKERWDEVDFLHANRHQTILQVDTINLGWYNQACPDKPGLQNLQNFCAISK